MERQSTIPPGVSAATCVLWHPAGLEPAAELTAALDRRGVANVRVQSPFMALAELCHLRWTAGHAPLVLLLVEPARLPDAAAVVRSCRQYAPRTVCWVYEAGAASRLRAVSAEALIGGSEPAAVQPEVIVRARSVPANPGGGPVRSTRVAQARKAGHPAGFSTAAPAAGIGPGPQLRLSGEVPLEGQTGNADSGVPGVNGAEPGETLGHGSRRNGASQLLTQEELAMLLADDRPE